jgi:hypothetical protein
MDLADLWSNSDFEFSQKVNAQNGPATVACKKLEVKDLPWNRMFF